MTQFVTVTLAIFAFQVFAQVYIMTKGGPGTATSTMQYLIYRNGFEYFRMGYASGAVLAVVFGDLRPGHRSIARSTLRAGILRRTA